MQAGLGRFAQCRKLQHRLVGIIQFKIRIFRRIIQTGKIDRGTFDRDNPAHRVTEYLFLEIDRVVNHTRKNNQRQHEQKRTDQHLLHGRCLTFRQALHIGLKRLKMDDIDQRDIGNRRRQEGMLDDFRVRNADIFHHQKGRSPHDRRHDLPVDRRCDFDRTGLLARETDTLHKRDGKGPGRYHVGNRGA